jgi:hypothetical protein
VYGNEYSHLVFNIILSKPQLVCINGVIYVIFPAPFPSGLNLKTYPEDQVIEEGKYILVYFLLIFKRKVGDV